MTTTVMALSQDGKGIIVVVGVLVLLLSITAIYAVFIIGGGSKKTGDPVVLIAGPCGSGKTGLFLRLRYNSDDDDYRETVMSSDRNEYKDENKGRILVDTPGHGKLRSIVFGEMVGRKIGGIIFVIDSSEIKSSHEMKREIGEFLTEILLFTEAGSSKGTTKVVPVLIACNKSDLFTSLPSSRIKTLVQHEIETIKRSKMNQLQENSTTSQDQMEEDYLKLCGDHEFDFDKLESTKVVFLSGSVASNKTELWTEWIENNV